MVDLRIDSQPGSSYMVLVGQTLNLSRDGAAKPVRVVLERSGAILAAAVSNEFGEFVLEYEAKEGLQLRVEALGQEPIMIALD